MAINFRATKNGTRSSVISIDPPSKTIRFCFANEAGDLSVSLGNYKDGAFDTEQLERIGKAVKAQADKIPQGDFGKVSLVLPDRLFVLDTVNIPVIHRKAMQNSLKLAIGSIYKNANELELMTYAVHQTKQTATYGLTGIRKDLLNNITEALAQNGASVSQVTFASNAMVNGAAALNPRLRGETFLLLDIKAEYTRFALVLRGCTMGYFDLPFGYSVIHASRLISEDTLFDRKAGELLVLNAKERALAKQLTVEDGGIQAENDEDDTADFESSSDAASSKNGKKLPKFMQRPLPLIEEEFMYENFRIFIKWALELIANNKDIIQGAKLDTVYVNMPSEYRFLLDTVNKKQEGGEKVFLPVTPNGADGAPAGNLELYGGFFLEKLNVPNTFRIPYRSF